MHDSANAGRRSIAILVQGGQVTLHQSNPAEGFRGAVSQGGPCGKRVPLLKLEPGRSFPTGPLGETATQNSGSKRDVVSQTGLFRKLCPTLKGETGMQVPGRASKTKLRWNSSCLGLQPAKTRTISPQLMRAGKMPALATKCHLRGLGGHSQRHVTEDHISYGIPSSTDTRCPTGLPSNEARRSLRQSAQCRQSADTAK